MRVSKERAGLAAIVAFFFSLLTSSPAKSMMLGIDPDLPIEEYQAMLRGKTTMEGEPGGLTLTMNLILGLAEDIKDQYKRKVVLESAYDYWMASDSLESGMDAATVAGLLGDDYLARGAWENIYKLAKKSENPYQIEKAAEIVVGLDLTSGQLDFPKQRELLDIAYNQFMKKHLEEPSPHEANFPSEMPNLKKAMGCATKLQDEKKLRACWEEAYKIKIHPEISEDLGNLEGILLGDSFLRSDIDEAINYAKKLGDEGKIKAALTKAYNIRMNSGSPLETKEALEYAFEIGDIYLIDRALDQAVELFSVDKNYVLRFKLRLIREIKEDNNMQECGYSESIVQAAESKVLTEEYNRYMQSSNPMVVAICAAKCAQDIGSLSLEREAYKRAFNLFMGLGTQEDYAGALMAARELREKPMEQRALEMLERYEQK